MHSMPWSDQNVSAARSGTFRNAIRTNQNAASLLWPGAYPWVDLLDGYDGDTPSELERDQMNIYTVGVVFTDGFEWGDTAAWSATLP